GQLGDDVSVYVEGCTEGAMVTHGESLTIAAQGDSQCLVSFEKIAPAFLVLGESYDIVVKATSETDVVITCFVRYAAGDEARYFGTTHLRLEAGYSERKALLDTEMP